MDATTVPRPTAIILTALPVEMAAVLRHLGTTGVETAGSILCERGSFVAENGCEWNVIVAQLGPGTVDTSSGVVAIAAKFNPDVLMFVGIAGGLKDVTIGDVVVATSVQWTERGKSTDSGYNMRALTAPLSPMLSQWGLKIARDNTWTTRLAKIPPKTPKVVVAPIASGEKVIASATARRELQLQFSDAVAIENEGYGFARAANVHTSSQTAVIRGISDIADADKADDAQETAAEAAAAFAYELLSRYTAVQVTAPPNVPSTGAEAAEVAPGTPGPGSTGVGQLAEALVADVDFLDDDRGQVEDLARRLAATEADADLADLVVRVGAALDGSLSDFLRRRLSWFGRQLLQTRPALVDAAGSMLETEIAAAPRGMASLLVEPAAWVRLPAAARRRCLTPLVGPVATAQAPDQLAVELLSPLLDGGLLNEAELSRVETSFELAAFDFLAANGMSLSALSPRLISDLRSGNFEKQNAAARFLYRTGRNMSSQLLSADRDRELGASLVNAATGSAHSFGAAEALTLSYTSSWDTPRLVGGVLAAVAHFDGQRLRFEASDHLGVLVAASAGADRLAEVLRGVREVLESTLEMEHRPYASFVAENVADLARSYLGNDKEALEEFARWLAPLVTTD